MKRTEEVQEQSPGVHHISHQKLSITIISTVLSDRFDFPLTTARPKMPNWFSSQSGSIL